MKHRLERFVGFLAITPRSKTHPTKVDGLDDPLLKERSVKTTRPYGAYSTYFRFLRRHDRCSGLFEDWFCLPSSLDASPCLLEARRLLCSSMHRDHKSTISAFSKIPTYTYFL